MLTQHSKFILTPISAILKDAVTALNGISIGIETYPMSEYVFQSIFLKMTGASEQKMKCMCWDMATYDYKYRYEYLRNINKYGECSNIDSKKLIIKDFSSVIKFSLSQSEIKQLILKSKDEVKNNIKNSVLIQWNKKDYDFFCTHDGQCKESQIKVDHKTQKLSLEEKFWEDYNKYVYDHRNRCAHNLKSYQVNLPTLSELASEKHEYDNYFYRFNIIILLDNIYMQLYNEYIEKLKSRVF